MFFLFCLDPVAAKIKIWYIVFWKRKVKDEVSKMNAF